MVPPVLHWRHSRRSPVISYKLSSRMRLVLSQPSATACFISSPLTTSRPTTHTNHDLLSPLCSCCPRLWTCIDGSTRTVRSSTNISRSHSCAFRPYHDSAYDLDKRDPAAFPQHSPGNGYEYYSSYGFGYGYMTGTAATPRSTRASTAHVTGVTGHASEHLRPRARFH